MRATHTAAWLSAALLCGAAGGAQTFTAARLAGQESSGAQSASVQRLVEEATTLLRSNEVAAAFSKLRQALDREPGNVDAHIQLGNALRRMELYERARREYERALELGGPNAELYQNLGFVEAKSSRFRAAARNFEKAIKIEPARSDLYHNLGKAYEEQARFDEALGAFEKALQLEPSDMESAAALGNLLIMKGRNQRAIEVLTAALAHSPDHAQTCYQAGLAFLNEAQPDRAVEYLQRAVRSDPALKGAWLNLGRAAQAAGREALGEQAFARFSSLYRQDRLEEAENIRLAQRIEHEVPAHHERAVRLSAEGRYREAIAELEEILELQPNDARTLLNVSRLHEALGDEARTRRYLERAAEADPGYVEPQLDLARLDRSQGRLEEALARTARVLGLQPDSGPAWLLRGALLAQERRWGESASALETAVEQLPRDPEPHRMLAVVYRELGRAADAERAGRRAAALASAAKETRP